MTHEELIDNGWEPKICKIGTLYFKDNFFISLDKEYAKVFHNSDDMNPIGEAYTLEEITLLQKYQLIRIIKAQESYLVYLKRLYFETYNEEYSE